MTFCIKIPKKIDINICTNQICIKGIFGEQTLNYSNLKLIILNDNLIIQNNNSCSLSYLQTFVSLIQQTFRGVLTGYKEQLILIGVGYRCRIVNNELELKLGFSHLVNIPIPNFLNISCPKPNKINIMGANKQKIGEFVYNLQNLRFPEPYKGKGIFKKNQKIIRKQGKKV